MLFWDKLGPLISNKNKMIEFSQKDTTAPPQTIPLDELQVVIQLKEICLSDIKLVVLLDVWHLLGTNVCPSCVSIFVLLIQNQCLE